MLRPCATVLADRRRARRDSRPTRSSPAPALGAGRLDAGDVHRPAARERRADARSSSSALRSGGRAPIDRRILAVGGGARRLRHRLHAGLRPHHRELGRARALRRRADHDDRRGSDPRRAAGARSTGSASRSRSRACSSSRARASTAPDPIGAALMATAGACWGVYSLVGRGAPRSARRDRRATSCARRSSASSFAGGVLVRASRHARRRCCSPSRPARWRRASAYTLWYAALPSLAAWRAAVVQLHRPGAHRDLRRAAPGREPSRPPRARRGARPERRAAHDRAALAPGYRCTGTALLRYHLDRCPTVPPRRSPSSTRSCR